MKGLLKVKDICDLLSVSRSTAYEWVNSGYLPYVILKHGEKKPIIRFDAEEIDTWLKKKKRETRDFMKLGRFHTEAIDDYEKSNQKGGEIDEHREA